MPPNATRVLTLRNATGSPYLRAPCCSRKARPASGFPLVLSGAVRVARGSPGGRTLELYRVTPGELCVVSTSCLFGQTPLTRAWPDHRGHRAGAAVAGRVRPLGARTSLSGASSSASSPTAWPT
ncbi:MAG: cyclic nucleotide-binding domain-containing protein [Comamonadaceae bacterium]|nr:cyclic nucleotide-binding domain-containing protein [Comamonadaceae bacterium]